MSVPPARATGASDYCAGNATIMTARHISLRVPHPGRTGIVSAEVSYSQVTWIWLSGPIAMGDL